MRDLPIPLNLYPPIYNNQTTMSADAFSSVPLAPEDAIFALTNSYKADKDESKINLGPSFLAVPSPGFPRFSSLGSLTS